MASELLEFPHDVRGLALNLEEDKVGVVLFGDFQKIKEGDLVKRTGRIMQVPVGPALGGRMGAMRAGAAMAEFLLGDTPKQGAFQPETRAEDAAGSALPVR